MPSKQLRYMRRYREEKREMLAAIKAAFGCQVCRIRDHSCLQFHHDDPATKEHEIARLLAGTWSQKVLMKELAKCSVLCANCHMRLHREEDEKRRAA